MNKAKEYEREVRAVTLDRNKAEAVVQVQYTDNFKLDSETFGSHVNLITVSWLIPYHVYVDCRSFKNDYPNKNTKLAYFGRICLIPNMT